MSDTREEDIKKLVEDMVKGDNSAFEQLYEITKNTVYFICLSFLSNEQDAKDIMQEVYIGAYGKISQLNEKEKFIPWINQIAVNRCKDFLIKNSKVQFTNEGYNDVQYKESEIFLPEEYITSQEKRKIIMDIMRECLSDIQYQTVILYYFNGLNIYEIADIMECPPGTVTYRLSVARAKLKEGVMFYETSNDYKLHSNAAVPFIASLLAAEAVGLNVPDVFTSVMSFIAGSGASGVAGVVGGTGTKSILTGIKTGLGTLKAKIAIGVASTVLVGGAIAAIVINNDKENLGEPCQELEHKNSDDMKQYFIDEYGFEMSFEYYKLSNPDNDGFALVYYGEEGAFRLDVQYNEHTNEPAAVIIYRCTSETGDDDDMFYELTTLFCDYTGEKEQIKDMIKANVEVEDIVIGDEKYSYNPCENGIQLEFINGNMVEWDEVVTIEFK